MARGLLLLARRQAPDRHRFLHRLRKAADRLVRRHLRLQGSEVTSDTTAEATTKKSGTTASSGSNEPTTKPVQLHSVTFINYDGSFISTQTVEDGKAATPPPDPVKPSDQYYDYKFKGWQLDFKKVTCDMTIAPSFEAILKPEYRNQQ